MRVLQDQQEQQVLQEPRVAQEAQALPEPQGLADLAVPPELTELQVLQEPVVV